jgi:peptide-methionine (R)-S-oxide reductase
MRKARNTPDATEIREVSKPDEQWRQELNPLQYAVLREAHTERPFTGEYVHNHADGSYRCAGCGSTLFGSGAKFDSGTGWPSFDEPAVADAVELRPDNSLFMRRTEVVCRRCGGHLGHLFSDGPTATGQRYCINSCSLTFDPAGAGQEPGTAQRG